MLDNTKIAFFKETEKIISKGLLIIMFMLKKYYLFIYKCRAVPLCSRPIPVRPSVLYVVEREAVMVLMILMLKYDSSW